MKRHMAALALAALAGLWMFQTAPATQAEDWPAIQCAEIARDNAEHQAYDLYPGWNHSVYCGRVTTPASSLAYIEGRVTVMFRYTPGVGWLSYIKGAPSNSLTVLYRGDIVWLYVVGEGLVYWQQPAVWGGP